MEHQIPQPILIPTLCPMSYGLQESPLTAGRQQLIQPTMVTGHPLLLHSHQGPQVVVQMHQVVPVVATDNFSFPVQTCSTPPNLLGSVPCIPQLPNPVFTSAKNKSVHVQQLRHKTTKEESNNLLSKTQKKKKVSPSAKRRSRLRLMAFLEAKKLASQQEEQTCDENDSNQLKETESESSAGFLEQNEPQNEDVAESEKMLESTAVEQKEANKEVTENCYAEI